MKQRDPKMLTLLKLKRKHDDFEILNLNFFLGVSLGVVPVMDLVYVKGEVGLYWAFCVTVVAVGLSGVGDALVQSGIVGNAGELPEREVPHCTYMVENSRVAIGGSIARLLLLSLFYGCLHGPKFFRGEIPVTVLTCLLASTNGYLTSVLMILAPKAVRLQHSETAGIVIVLFQVVGLAVGSIVWLGFG